MWLLVRGEQLILEKEPANPHDEFAVAVIKDSHIGGRISKIYSQITWHFYYTKGLCHLSYYWEKEERKRLIVYLRYSVYFYYNAVSPSH